MVARQGEMRHGEHGESHRPRDARSPDQWERDDDLQSHYDDASPEDIEADIRRTRAEMDETLDELQKRLSPRNIWQDVVGMFRSKTSKKSHGEAHGEHDGSGGGAGAMAKKVGLRVLQTVRDHPVPAVLVTTAVTTLIYESASRRKANRSRHIRSINIYRGEPTMYGGSHVHAQSGQPYGQTGEHTGQQQFQFGGSADRPQHDEPGAMHRAGQGMKEMTSKVGEKMSHASESVRGGMHQASESVRGGMHQAKESVRSGMHRTSEALSSGIHQVKDTASHFGEQVRHGMDNTREFVEERPLTVGIGAMALGLIAGLLIPRTEREDRLMGEHSEHFMERTKEVGHDVLERGKHVAEEAMEAATEAASEESERQGLKPRNG